MHSNYLGAWFLLTMALALIFIVLLACRRLFKPPLFSKILFYTFIAAGPWFLLGSVLGIIDLSSDFSQTSEYATPVRWSFTFGRTTTAPSTLALVPLFVIGSLGTIIDILLWRGAAQKRTQKPAKTR